MTKKEIIEGIWNICTRLGLMDGEIYNIRHGTKKEPLSLPYKLIILINQNFDNLYEVNKFFAPMNKKENMPKFINMLNKIAPFTTTEFIIDGAMFTVENKIYTVVETNFEG